MNISGDPLTSYGSLPAVAVPKSAFWGDKPIPDDAYCMACDGDCLSPLILDGEKVIASPTAPLVVGKPVALFLANGHTAVKILELPPLQNMWTVDGRHFLEVSMLNPKQKFTITLDSLIAVHAVIGVLHKDSSEAS